MPLVEDGSDVRTPPSRAGREAFLAKARARFKVCVEAETVLRANMLDDLRFRASDQWPDAIRRQREADGRPCLTINRLPQIIRQITNQQRENKPAAMVSPVDNDADVKTAEVFQGMIRHIEQRSQAQVAYNTAGEHQATIGRGFLRLITEYESDTDTNQTLRIKRVRNPFMVYPDPACQELDYSDAAYWFVVLDLTADAYDELYGDTDPVSLDDFSSIGAEKTLWLEQNMIRVAEYWYVETEDDTLLTVATGDSILRSRVPKDALVLSGKTVVAILDDQRQPVPITQSRPTKRKSVKWALISGIAILDGNDERTAGRVWLNRAKSIPIVPVIGDEIDINGVVDLRGVVRDAKDPQRRYNFWVSAQAEAGALAPKAPFVAADGQIAGYEEQWKNANVKNYAVLTYKAQSLDGHLVGPPVRNSASTDLQAFGAGTLQADNDLKAVTGFYDASLGAPGPEQSGKAILARQRQGDVGSYNYQDNMNLAIATLGRYMVDVIPEVYDAPRIMRILGEDGKKKTVMVHAGQPPAETPSGVEGVFDVGVGTYDVVVSSGPSYQAKRQEQAAMLTQFVQAYPPAFPIVGDILVRSMDMPGADQAADRLAKMLPPQLQDAEAGKPEPPPEMLQQMQQMDQVIQKMSAELEQTKQALAAKQIESQSAEKIAQMEIVSREKIAQLQAQSAMAKVQGGLAQKNLDLQNAIDTDVAQIETGSRERIAQLNAATELAKTDKKIDGTLELEAIRSQLAVLSARLGLASGDSSPSDRADT